ncbi:hypothetical protein CPC08DRAFT_704012 [Agrocybe pediades]|nr:hypothetical protein CPC08DRAFT_704012 [Agrocybe pediades]
MPRLRDLIRSTAESGVQFLGRALSRACHPGVPPRNWNTYGSTTTQSFSRLAMGSSLVPNVEVSLAHTGGSLLGTQTSSSGARDQQHLSPPERLSLFDASSYDSLQGYGTEPEATVYTLGVPQLEFSIYSDVSSPDLNRAMLITPTRPMRTSHDVGAEEDLVLLREASERVSEILRENRRRLDSGEDTNVARKEARRRRALELANSRKGLDDDSLFWRS